MSRSRSFPHEHGGPGIAEWLGATLLLTLAFLALLQIVGPRLQILFDAILEFVRSLLT